jgi:hypothetical protein
MTDRLSLVKRGWYLLYGPPAGSLQAWLEAAWADGFDQAGAESLGGSIQASVCVSSRS